MKLVFDFHPNFAKEKPKKALPIAVGNLTLKAWDAYLAANGVPAEGEPVFIQVLRTRQARKEASASPSQPSEPSTAPSLPPDPFPPEIVNVAAPELQPLADPLQPLQWNADFVASLEAPTTMPVLPPFDPDQMNWSNWDNLLADFEMQGAGEFQTDVTAFDFGMQ